ncbi:MAG TPA: VOC family protein [Burkholderiales bacterium]|nr:VOC family protein [Burkholderiales bacterium]
MKLATRGVHHLALNTEDMRMTVDFYTKVVGMPLVHAMKVPPGLGTGPGNRGNPPYEAIRHYFFDMGNDSLLAFFEIPPGAEPKAKRDAIGGMQHVAFAVTPRNFAAIRKRLKKARVAFDGPIKVLPGLVSIYFMDPNGIRLEACCQPAAKEKPRVIRSVAQKRADARRELESIDASWARTSLGSGEFT